MRRDIEQRLAKGEGVSSVENLLGRERQEKYPSVYKETGVTGKD